jgi:hypothetical protein
MFRRRVLCEAERQCRLCGGSGTGLDGTLSRRGVIASEGGWRDGVRFSTASSGRQGATNGSSAGSLPSETLSATLLATMG